LEAAAAVELKTAPSAVGTTLAGIVVHRMVEVDMKMEAAGSEI
jgi:hypothetical protein